MTKPQLTKQFHLMYKNFFLVYALLFVGGLLYATLTLNFATSSKAETMITQTRTFRMRPQIQSGNVTLTQIGDNQVKVELRIASAGLGTQPAHIHTGTCAKPGPILFDLNDVVNGVSLTTLNTSMRALLSQQTIVNVHKSASEINIYTSCAPISGGSSVEIIPAPTTIVISPEPSCTPRPPCLDSIPKCYIAEPASGWCPTTASPYPTRPMVTCIPRPRCLDSVPRCMIAEPAEGWCPTTTSVITPKLMPPARAF